MDQNRCLSLLLVPILQATVRKRIKQSSIRTEMPRREFSFRASNKYVTPVRMFAISRFHVSQNSEHTIFS